MTPVNKPLRVCHYAQIPCKPFIVEVTDEKDAKRIMDILANQHVFLFNQSIIPEYSNVMLVEMWNHDSKPTENGRYWEIYFNEDESMEWEELEDTYLNEC